MGKITLYDDTAKINAACLYAASGNYSQVARDTNIPRTTILSWAKDSAVWVESLVKARQEINDEILAGNLKLVIKTNEETMDRVEHGDYVLTKDGKQIRVPMKGRDLAVVGGIKEDKARVALGQATSISVTQDSRELAEVCKELSRAMRRDDRVVSVQTKNQSKTDSEDNKDEEKE